MTEPTRITIDIWSDIMCPWCVVGYYQLQQALAGLKGEIETEVRWHPFELNPDMGPEGEEFEAHIQRKYGRPLDPGLTARIQEMAAAAGHDMRYQGGEPEPESRLWNTRLAHLLLHYTLMSHGPELQTRLKLALFDAHFQYRRNVSDPAVLLDVATGAGLEADEVSQVLADESLLAIVKAEEEDALGKGIHSVPAMVFAGRFMVPGAQSPEVYTDVLRKVAAKVNEVA